MARTWLPANQINIGGLRNIIKSDCEMCDLRTLSKEERCKPCNFILHSKSVGDKKRLAEGKEPLKSRFGLGAVLKEFGFPKDSTFSNYGKHQVFLFLHYPELGGIGTPLVPDMDLFRKINEASVDIAMVIDYTKIKKLQWNVHHINKRYWDDRKINLALCLNSEHKVIEETTNNTLRNKYLNAVAKRNLILLGTPACPTFR